MALPRGRLLLDSPADYALQISGLNNFRIEGKGTTFVIARSNQGFANLSSCSRVALTGFSVEHRVPSMTQGWIRSVSKDMSSYEVEIMPGFPFGPDDFPERPVGYIFDPKSLDWKKGSIDLYFEKVTRLSGRTLRLDLGRPVKHEAAVGDLMAFRGKWRTEVIFSDCSQMKVHDVTLRSSPGFGLQESGGEGGNVYQYKVTRGPVPLGAPMAPLLSSNADAFHSNSVRKGPRLENCHFEYMADDGVPIHGNYLAVADSGPQKLVLSAPWAAEWFRVGDRVRVYSKGGASLLTSSKLPRVKGYRQINRSVSPSSYLPLQGKSHIYEVLLDSEVAGVDFDSLATNAECQGDGFVVKGNSILNNRARGMLITASNGLIENNIISGSTIAGIVISPELYWLQSDYSSQIVIRGNKIKNVSRAAVGPWSNQVGGIVITAEIPRGKLHRDILIEGNSFEQIYGAAVVIRHADRVHLKDNHFTDLRRVVNDAGKDHGLPTGGEVFIDDASVVR